MTAATAAGPDEGRARCPRVPLWVGAVGHRYLLPGSEAALRRAVGEVLDALERRWGAGLELRLLSSLAEGADQLIAEEARARGWALAVPLPLPEDLYERDFGSHAALETFRRLRSQAMVFDVGLAPGVSLDHVREPGKPREAQYARAGRVVAETCPILIALWDGEDNHRTGGTSEMIARVVRGWREESGRAQILDPQQPKLVYHIWTPSREHPDITGVPFTCRPLVPHSSEEDGENEKVLDAMVARLGELDADLCRVRRNRSDRVERSAADAIRPEQTAGLPREFHDLLDWYAVVDALAMRQRALVHWVLPALLVIAVLAFGAYEVHVHWPSKPRWGLAVFLVSFAGMFIALKLSRAPLREGRFLDYRALAEGLRVQLFWRLCGLQDSVSEHYLRRHRGELSWIPMAVASLSLGAGFPEGTSSTWPLGRRRHLARECWLKRQRAFFAAGARSAGRRAVWNLWTAYVFLAAALVAVAGLLWKGGSSTHCAPHDMGVATVHIGIAVLLAISAALRHFVERRAYETNARRYELMHALATRALHAVGTDRESLESKDAADVFREFGRESLSENGDWLLLHRERPLEVPPPA